MERNERRERPVKLTITFADGHTKDYNVFMGVAAGGIIPADKIDGRVVYMAPEEGFSTQGFIAIAATSEIVAGLIKTMVKLLADCIEGFISNNPENAMEILKAMEGMSTKSTELYRKTQVIRKDISGN